MATEDLIRTHGPTLIKGLAVAGVGGAIISRLMMSRADAESPGPKKIFPGGPAMVRLSLESAEDVNHNTKRLRFALPGEDDISGLPLTSALLTLSWPKGHLLPVARPYTPVSPSDAPGVVDFLIKRYPGGRQSTHLHSLAPGDTCLFAVAIPGYKWVPNRHDSVTLVAGGAGITPMFQLVQGILADPQDRTRITLVFGVNEERDVLLLREFEDYEARFPGRFRAVYAVSDLKRAEGEGRAGRFRRGYVTEELLKEVAAPPGEANTKVMVCGPPAMEEVLLGKKGWAPGSRSGGILERLGYRKEQIHQF